MNNFNFWEDSAESVVDGIFNFSEDCGNEHLLEVLAHTPALHFAEYTFTSQEPVGVLKSIIDFYLENCSPDKTEDSDSLNRAVESLFLISAAQAIRIFESKIEEEDSTLDIYAHMDRYYISNTVIRKQHDYGPNNIAKFGLYGIMIRLHDKIARLENLLSSKRNGKNMVSDETVFDTLTDVVGYCTVGIMWINKTFLLPLKKDNGF